MDHEAYWVVVPTRRPENKDNVIANHARQSVKSRLLVVENGAAVGSYKRGDDADVVLQSMRCVGDARAVALAWIKGVAPDTFIVWMDDDDYYYPDYIETHIKAYDGLPQAAQGHLMGAEGELFWMRRTHGIMGATLFGRASDFTEPDRVNVGEEDSMVKKGLKKVDLPMVINRRRHDHTWNCSNALYWKLAGGGVPVSKQQAEEIMCEQPVTAPLSLREAVVQYKHVFVQVG
jgi:hypothetical protein